MATTKSDKEKATTRSNINQKRAKKSQKILKKATKNAKKQDKQNP